jgi:hypothetical protein
MGDRERRMDRAEEAHAYGGLPPTAGALDGVRQTGERLLAAADDAIRRTLSGDSEEFMRASRQEGGQ